MEVLLNFRLDVATKTALADLARQDERSLSAYVRRILHQHIDAANGTTTS